MERSEIIAILEDNKFNHINYTTHLDKYGNKRAFAEVNVYKGDELLRAFQVDGRVVKPMIKKGILEWDRGYSEQPDFKFTDESFAGYRLLGTKLLG